MNEELNEIFVDVATGETVVKPLSEEDIANRKKLLAEEKKGEAEAKAKAEARISALAKLAALGLTEAEIATL